MSSTTMQPQAITVNEQNLAVIKLMGLSSNWRTYSCMITPTSPGTLTLVLHFRDGDGNNPSTEVDPSPPHTALAVQAAPSIHLKMLRTPSAPDRLRVLQDFEFEYLKNPKKSAPMQIPLNRYHSTNLENDADKENECVGTDILDGEGSLSFKHIKLE
ncbi:hypothetical protein PAXRUDRAFT_20557 [Paxillus rubicundulus Ve08.2h10]|uniref:Uncharacterized protein n=1 Tax=Paxillus rubicundulus Ve08.2h10 TaxID=930991 RepID=A0A0D0D953_9AGAM|nr:hypothetical protein PAXRUDRAFT_20557 [Paxillus rubicundulus Ve08.2h10]